MGLEEELAIEISFQLKIIGRIKLFVCCRTFPTRKILSTDWNENKQIIVLFANLHSIDKEEVEEPHWMDGGGKGKIENEFAFTDQLNGS